MITIVVGGQFGGEGKGKISAYLAAKEKIDIACRCGGPNSSHTVIWKNKSFRLRMLPTAAVVNPAVSVFFGAGTLIHIPTLLAEIDQIGFSGQLLIDRQAGIVTDEIINQQRRDKRYERLGSTLTGTGHASAMRCLRSLPLAREFHELQSWTCNLTPELMSAVADRKKILIEGHQGFGLSNYHGDYPYTSSRDSTAASMLAELGLGPRFKSLKVVLAAKMFPTRNHQGDLGEEMPTEEAEQIGIREYGGGSWGIPDRRRRVGYLDLDLLRRAAFVNGATQIALTGIDYYDHTLKYRTKASDMTHEIRRTVDSIYEQVGVPVRFLSTGPETEAMVELAHDGNTKRRGTPVEDPQGLWRN